MIDLIRLVVEKTEHGTFAIIPKIVAQEIVKMGLANSSPMPIDTFAKVWKCPWCWSDVPGGQYHDCKNGLKAPLNAADNVVPEPFLGEAHQSDLEKAHGDDAMEAADLDELDCIALNVEEYRKDGNTKWLTTIECHAKTVKREIAALRAELMEERNHREKQESVMRELLIMMRMKTAD